MQNLFFSKEHQVLIFNNLIIFFCVLFFSIDISAQEVRQDNSNDAGSIIVYDPEYFKPYRPMSAEDMLRRIPGTEGLLNTYGFNQNDKRGLRSNTDQILINGKRLTGKQVSSSVFLANLPAKSVKRIELITGNVKELDTNVGSRVINVILNEDASTGSGVVEAGISASHKGPKQFATNISYSGDLKGISYATSFQLRPWSGSVDIKDVFTNPQMDDLSREFETQRSKQVIHIARGSLSYDTAVGNVSINGLIDHLPVNKQYISNFFSDPTNDFIISSENFLDNLNGDNTKWEISGDITYRFNKKTKLVTLFVYSNAENNRNNTNYNLPLGFTDTDSLLVPLNNLEQLGGDNRDKSEAEKIIRATLDFNLNENNQFEIGVEGAVNTLDKRIEFYDLVNDIQVNIPIINSDQKITEDRIEIFTSHSWKPFKKIEIETELAGEFSSLDQVGSDVSSSRTLRYFKPRFNIFYDPNESSQVYFSLIRSVGQLDFDDFIATVNREDDEILAGNPELVPEKDWNFELGTEYRLKDGSGVLNWRAFYRIVNDVEDLTPLGIDDSQPGNLGTGYDYGVELEASIRFGKFTKLDALLSGSALIRKSSITDPFTGIKRRFGNQPKYEFRIEGSHDIKSLGLRYGFDFAKIGPKIESDFNEFDDKSFSSGLRLYLRKKIIDRIDLSLYWANALEQTTSRERKIFSPSQLSGQISEIQFREFKRLYFYGFRLRSTF